MTTKEEVQENEARRIQARMQRAHDGAFEMANAVSRAGRSIELLMRDHGREIDSVTERRARDAAMDIANGWDRLARHPGMTEQRKAERLAESAADAAEPANLREAGLPATAEAMAENLAEMARTWSDLVTSDILGRNTELVLHIVESDEHATLWAVEMDPARRQADPAEPDRLPSTATAERIALTLGLQDGEYETDLVPAETTGGEQGNAEAVRLTAELAARALRRAQPKSRMPRTRLGAATLVWLRWRESQQG